MKLQPQIPICVLIATVAVCALPAQSLDALIEKALSASPQIQQLAYQKENTLLTIQHNELQDHTIQYALNPSVLYQGDGKQYDDLYGLVDTNSLAFGSSTGQLLQVSIPGSYDATTNGEATDNTVFTLNPYGTVSSDSSGEKVSSGGVSLGLAHTFLFGDYRTTIRDLTDAKLALSAEQSYQTGVNTITKTLLSLVQSIINGEKEQADYLYKREKLQKTMDDDLALQTVDTSSLSYRANKAQQESYTHTIDNLTRQIDNTKQQFLHIAGVPYVPLTIDDIRTPQLSVSRPSEKSLSLQIAEIERALNQARLDHLSILDHRSNLVAEGSLSTSFQKGTSRDISRLNGSVGLTYSAKNWAVATQVGTSSSSDNQSDWTMGSPYVQITGRLSNDTTTAERNIEKQNYENDVNLSLIDEDTLKNQELIDEMTVNNDINSWLYEQSERKNLTSLHLSNVALQKQLASYGVASSEDVRDAQHLCDLDEKANMISRINGLIIENAQAKLKL